MKRLLFIHIPRTAGRSISENGKVMMTNAGHVFAKDIDNINDYYSFCFVRNPYDRFLSSYYFYRDIYKGGRIIGNQIQKYESFKQFVLLFDNFSCRYDLQFIPQYKFITDYVDFIGAYDNLNEEWELMLNLSGNEYHKLPHINNTNHWEWESMYDDDMRDIVYKLFKEDFKQFGYKK